MKRIVILVMTVLTMVMAFGINAKAGVRDDITRERFKTDIEEDFAAGYETFKELKADGDIRLIKDFTMDYTEVGINVYDLCMSVVLEDGQTFEVHAFYDAVEDEYFSEYVQFGNERMSYEEFEELYPELYEEIA